MHRSEDSEHTKKAGGSSSSRSHNTDRDRSRDKEAKYRGTSTTEDSNRKSHLRMRSELMKKGGATPLIFKGTKGAKLEPRALALPIEESKTGINSAVGKDLVGESGMYAGGHFSLDNNYASFEWEENAKEIDRAWYDCDEIGNVVYGNDQYEPPNMLKRIILTFSHNSIRKRRESQTAPPNEAAHF